MTGSALQRVSFGERLAFQNVVSARATFHYSELAGHLDEFAGAVNAAGCEPMGPLFYSLNNVPMDEMVDIEMFLPIRQNVFDGADGLRFSSYFEVFPLLRGVVTGDSEHQTEAVYAQLLEALEVHELEINSPFFHVFQKDGSPHALIYLGYMQGAPGAVQR